jgi:hypothetical protein
MSRLVRLAVCLVALLSTGAAFAQDPEAQTDENAPETTSGPVAHVYVGNGTQILAFSAAANGKLTPVPGSPFNEGLSWMGANGHYFFGFEGSGTIIASFSMASDGALRNVATIDTADYANGCGPYQTGFRIDHSGQNLYSTAITTEFPCWTPFSSFRIDDADGKLTFLSNTGTDRTGTFWATYPGLSTDEGTNLSILGNNQYAYLPVNFFFSEPPSPRAPIPDSGGWVCEFIPFERLSSGELVDSGATITIPAAPNDSSDPTQPSPGSYCPVSGATDPTNHIALLLDAIDNDLGNTYGPAVIAPFTADANGNLKTTSTSRNMPVSETGGSGLMRMSPSGKLLAVGGGGLELFHFNGANPITKYKLLLSGDAIAEILWDNNNHMYAIGTDSANAGKVWVYTVTPTSVTEAPGSPYSIPNAANMVVQPL